MAGPQDNTSYLDVDQLAAYTGLSTATIWRLKKAGKIPFFQPAGKNGRVVFPANAIELVEQSERSSPQGSAKENEAERLPGPRPQWMSPGKQTRKKR